MTREEIRRRWALGLITTAEAFELLAALFHGWSVADFYLAMVMWGFRVPTEEP